MNLILTLLVILSLTHLVEMRKRKKSRGRKRTGLERSSRGLVPQLMANYSSPSLPPASDVMCGQASLVCANREGCGLALQHYLSSCSDLVTGLTSTCSRDCRLALIALLSTPEGERLMQCQCQDEDCRLQKERVEPCRNEVIWNTREDRNLLNSSSGLMLASQVTLCSL